MPSALAGLGLALLCPSASAVQALHSLPPERLPPGQAELMHLDRSAKAKHHINQCRTMYTPPLCEEKPDMGQFSAAAVVSTYREDLYWLNEMGWDGDITVYVHNRAKQRSHESKEKSADNLLIAEESEVEVKAANLHRAKPIHFEYIPNIGDEATAYLSFIIQKYYKLPDVVFFLQGHRCAQHATFDMSKALPNIRRCFKPEDGYLNLNDYRKQDTKCKLTDDLIEHPIRGFHLDHFNEQWALLFRDEFGAMPSEVCWDSYAQFAVTRERILSHPLTFYKGLFQGVKHGNTTMEFWWRMVFVPWAITK